MPGTTEQQTVNSNAIIALINLHDKISIRLDELRGVVGECSFMDDEMSDLEEIILDIIGIPAEEEKGDNGGYCRDYAIDILNGAAYDDNSERVSYPEQRPSAEERYAILRKEALESKR